MLLRVSGKSSLNFSSCAAICSHTNRLCWLAFGAIERTTMATDCCFQSSSPCRPAGGLIRPHRMERMKTATTNYSQGSHPWRPAAAAIEGTKTAPHSHSRSRELIPTAAAARDSTKRAFGKCGQMTQAGGPGWLNVGQGHVDETTRRERAGALSADHAPTAEAARILGRLTCGAG